MDYQWGQSAISPDLVQTARSRADAWLARAETARLAEAVAGSDRVCGAFAAEALRALAGHVPSEPDGVAEVAERVGIIRELRPLFARLAQMVNEDGLRNEIGSAQQLLMNWQRQFPEEADLLRLVAKCGPALPAVLRGEEDAMWLLFEGGSTADVEAVYRSPAYGLFPELIRDVVLAKLAGHPGRVLEVGGGTGAATTALLPVLSGRGVQYVFTDLAHGFVRRAARRFSEWPFVTYGVLDVQQDPIEQGFAAESVDVIVAGLVLHAAADLHVALHNLRTLLEPGGVLVLVEGRCPCARHLDLTFGLLPGWWAFTDRDLRPSHPYLAEDRWPELLAEAGYAQIELVPSLPAAHPALQSVLVAARRI